jgi:hypothetical protein
MREGRTRWQRCWSDAHGIATVPMVVTDQVPGSATEKIAGPLIGSPSIEKYEPWQGRSQHPSNAFQRRMHGAYVHTAERTYSAPASSR